MHDRCIYAMDCLCKCLKYVHIFMVEVGLHFCGKFHFSNSNNMWDRKIILQGITDFFSLKDWDCCAVSTKYALQKHTMGTFPFVILLLLRSTHHSDFLEFIIKTRLNSSSFLLTLNMLVRHCMWIPFSWNILRKFPFGIA